MPKLHGNQLYGKFKATLRDSPQNNREEWVKQGRVSWRVAGMGLWHWIGDVGGQSLRARRDTRQSGGQGSDVLHCPLWVPVGMVCLSSWPSWTGEPTGQGAHGRGYGNPAGG